MNKRNLGENPTVNSDANQAGSVWSNVMEGESPGATDAEQRNKNATRSRPGKLRSWINARFHTNEAIAAVEGRFEDGMPHIIGLREFARKSQIAYEMSALDDPFADYLLVQIESRDEEVREYMRQSSKRYHALKDQALTNEVRNIRGEQGTAFKFSKTGSTQPKPMRFFFGNYASRALFNVVQYDEIVMLLKTMEHRGIIERDECRVEIQKARHLIRSFLALGHNYVYGGCTRSDLRDRNRVAIAAVEKLLSKGFLDSRMFNGMDDVCAMFADYGERPKYGPIPKGGQQLEEQANEETDIQ